MSKKTAQTKPRWLLRDIAAPAPYYTLVLNQAEFDAELKRMGVPLGTKYLSGARSNATTTFLDSDAGHRCAIVALGPLDGRSGVEIAGLLVHEAVHIWQNYIEGIGEHNPGDEQEAYGIQYIAGRLMEEFARRMGAGNE